MSAERRDSGVIPRDGIVEIVGLRNNALQLFERAFQKIREASEAVARAEAEVVAACGGLKLNAYVDRHVPEIAAFEDAVQLPDADQYLRVARRLTDIRVWAALIERTDLEHLMDKQAKDELRAQMAYVPERVDRETGAVINAEEIAKGLPEASVEVIEETLRGLVEDSWLIFRRGIANVFSQLDRRFRSHDGFKIGSRVILSTAFDGFGWNYYRGHRDTLTDIERVFLVLDGKGPRASYAGIVGTIDAERRSSIGCRQTEHQGDYFRVRIFKNGNAHLWFTRPDLVRTVNQLLAEFYGAAIGEGKDRAPDPQAPLTRRSVGHARGFGFFQTPDAIAERIVDDAHLYRRDGDPPLRCLEPSAGRGALAERMVKHGHRVDVVEIQPDLADELERCHSFARVYRADFLQMPPSPEYDRIVMNPPFDRTRDVDHVAHAWHFLKPGGRLVAIMSAGTEFREDRKTLALRELLNANGAVWRDLPMGSFSSQGTNVSTLYVTVTRKK